MQKIIEMNMPFRRGVQQFPHQFIAVTPHVTTANYYTNFLPKGIQQVTCHTKSLCK